MYRTREMKRFESEDWGVGFWGASQDSDGPQNQSMDHPLHAWLHFITSRKENDDDDSYYTNTPTTTVLLLLLLFFFKNNTLKST